MDLRKLGQAMLDYGWVVPSPNAIDRVGKGLVRGEALALADVADAIRTLRLVRDGNIRLAARRPLMAQEKRDIASILRRLATYESERGTTERNREAFEREFILAHQVWRAERDAERAEGEGRIGMARVLRMKAKDLADKAKREMAGKRSPEARLKYYSEILDGFRRG